MEGEFKLNKELENEVKAYAEEHDLTDAEALKETLQKGIELYHEQNNSQR